MPWVGGHGTEWCGRLLPRPLAPSPHRTLAPSLGILGSVSARQGIQSAIYLKPSASTFLPQTIYLEPFYLDHSVKHSNHSADLSVRSEAARALPAAPPEFISRRAANRESCGRQSASSHDPRWLGPVD